MVKDYSTTTEGPVVIEHVYGAIEKTKKKKNKKKIWMADCRCAVRCRILRNGIQIFARKYIFSTICSIKINNKLMPQSLMIS